MKRILQTLSLCLLTVLPIVAQNNYVSEVWVSDLGNGKYKNPVLYADYSDPDACRVGDDFYMTSSSFNCLPGLQILHSKDLVNWTIIGAAVPNALTPIETPEHPEHGNRIWAPSIRHHKGEFYIFWGDPDQGAFMVKAKDPKGPWTPIHCVKNVGGWEDPCPLWDDDGQTYLGRSQLGAGPIIIHKMSSDGKSLLDDGHVVYTGPVAEGTKFHKRDGYYYISIPEGGVGEGWQTILRSKNIYGPYEKKVVLEKGSTPVNGPHQGALVDTPEGEWWFFHFQLTEPLGRVVHLQPAHWKDGWPVIGVDMDMNGIGEPVKVWTKPTTGKNPAISLPQGGDSFDSPDLHLQWQFNHNPSNEHWSLNERKGWLMLEALKADKLRNSRNMLTQKCMGYEGVATTEMDMNGLTDGQRAGLFCIGHAHNGIGVMKENGKRYVYLEKHGEIEKIKEINAKKVYFRVTLNARTNRHQLAYSLDNKTFTSCGEPYWLHFGDWKGARIGLYSYNTLSEGGKAYFNWFNYDFN